MTRRALQRSRVTSNRRWLFTKGICYMITDYVTTVNPQDADSPSVILTARERRFEHVTIYQSLGRWHWKRLHRDGRLAMASNESFADDLSAAMVAATVAHCEGIPCVLPRSLEPELAEAWQRQGAQKFAGGYAVDVCWNSYQRAGYEAAAAAADEAAHMDRDLAMFRSALAAPFAVLTDAQLEQMEAEVLLTDWRS